MLKKVLNKETNHIYVIAEIGINHNGSLQTALDLIDSAYESGVDAVKFQKRNINNIYNKKTINDPNSAEWNVEYLIKELKQLEFGKKEYDIIYDKCKSLQLDLIITPFDIESVDFVLQYNVVAFKNASCNMNNYKLIDYIATKNLPVLISTGMWSDDEIKESIQYFKLKNINYTLLLANSTYPCPYEDLNINYINTLKKYSNVVGYSGHERGNFIPIAVAALGAKIIEKHITFDRNQQGLDHKASMEPHEWKEMVHNLRLLETALGSKKIVNQAEILAKQSFCLSPYAIRDVKVGEKLNKDMFELLAPGKGILQNELSKYLGKEIKLEIKKNDCISKSFFEETILVKDWKIANFKKKWGVKCRFHDFLDYSVLSSPVIEFHCSQKDIYDPITGIASNTSQLIVHAPEIVDRMLVDICSKDEFQVQKSISILQDTINKTIKLSKNFKGKPKLVVHFGGMCLKPCCNVEKTQHEMFHKSMENFKKLNYNPEEIEILPENLPPKPWYLGGEWNQYGFMTEKYMIDFCKKFDLKITYDVCHAKLYCNYMKKDIVEYTKKIKKYISHVHISDTKGINGEGVQINEGDTDFLPIFKELKDLDFSWVTEIWAGHINNGKGCYNSMKLLEPYKKLI
uniref:AFP-like domain-containing protein n=1 Tax=viral metagenome TaxID=1070528 RepID=A0A6C0C1Y0_9ZZZZ